MINSRDTKLLQPEAFDVLNRHVSLCELEGIRLIITSTYRDYEEQDFLYAQGRTSPGKIVTDARAGQSFHNFKCAWDAVPLDSHGQCIWNEKDPTFLRMVELGRQAGAECGADWISFKDYDHFQYNPKKLTTAEAKAEFDAIGKLSV